MSSFFSKLFGSKDVSAKAAEKPEMYNDFAITPKPLKESGGFRVAAQIEKTIGAELKSHHMMRADVLGSEEEARAESLRKAKVFIDQMGNEIFD